VSRRSLRIHTFKLVYQIEFYIIDDLNYFLENYITRFKVRNHDEISLIKKEFSGVINNLDSIDKIITKYSKWSIDRLNKIDLALLRLALYEIIFEKDISTTEIIIISEIVDIANNYGDSNSADFVNGLLARFIETNYLSYNY
jgi:N utilization substance protein B